MKKALASFGQFLLFLAVFAVGSFLHPFNLHWGLTVTSPSVTRYFVPDGLLLALGIFLAIVIIQAIRKRTCDTPWTIIGFLLAIAVGYALKFGFVTKDLF
jgi:hypothetical protein